MASRKRIIAKVIPVEYTKEEVAQILRLKKLTGITQTASVIRHALEKLEQSFK